MPFPNLFIVGAMKAGTTTLHSWLSGHPHVYMPPVKEPNFFSKDLWSISPHIALGTDELVRRAFQHPIHSALIADERLYETLYPKGLSGYCYLGDTSPSYLRSEIAAKEIREKSPDAKIVIITRDPIERAWSHFLMERNEARVPEDFSEMIEQERRAYDACQRTQHGILESGLYFRCISRYLEAFSPSRVLILDQSELRNRRAILTRLSSFLALDESLFAEAEEVTNATLGPRFPALNRVIAASGVKHVVRLALPRGLIDTMKTIYYRRGPAVDSVSEAVRCELRNFYADDVVKLVDLLGERAPQWATRYNPAQ